MPASPIHQAMNTIAILGSGQMGSGIAHTVALAGYPVYLFDTNPTALKNAQQTITRDLSRQIKIGHITPQQSRDALAKITPQTALGGWLAHSHFIIEAVSENWAIKQQLLADIQPHIAPHAILASNTSSYSITQLAATTPCPDRFIGMHFMHPAPIIPLVEIISGTHTSPNTYQQTNQLAQALGKQTVHAKDTPGFIANRILLAMLNEAMFALADGCGSVADIDKTMQLGMNHPMGPLQLADFIGLDTCLSILSTLSDGMPTRQFRPCPLLKKLVDDGHLGKKSGQGFYNYTTTPPQPLPLSTIT